MPKRSARLRRVARVMPSRRAARTWLPRVFFMAWRVKISSSHGRSWVLGLAAAAGEDFNGGVHSAVSGGDFGLAGRGCRAISLGRRMSLAGTQARWMVFSVLGRCLARMASDAHGVFASLSWGRCLMATLRRKYSARS